MRSLPCEDYETKFRPASLSVLDSVDIAWAGHISSVYFRADLERDFALIGRVAKSIPHAINKE